MAREKIRNPFLYCSQVENIFISEYMIDAGAVEVKAYLCGLMESQMGLTVDNERIAKAIAVPVDKIEAAWDYWEDMGIIYRIKGDIVFCSLREQFFGNADEENNNERSGVKSVDKEKSASKIDEKLIENSIREMFSVIERSIGRGLSSNELEESIRIVRELGMSTELFAYAFSYFSSMGQTNYNYIRQAALNWYGKGLTTIKEVEDSMVARDNRHQDYKRIKEALGFFRALTEKEKEIVDTWFDSMNFTMQEVLDACSKTAGINNPNINYVNKVLENWKTEAEGKSSWQQKRNAVPSKKQVLAYYDYLRNRNKDIAESRRAKVNRELPELVAIDEEISRLRKELVMALSKLGSGDKGNQSEIKAKIEEKQKLKERILIKNNISPDLLDVKYTCYICKDTGLLENGTTCKCYVEREQEAKEWLKTKK